MICDSELFPSLAAEEQTSPSKTRVRGSSQEVLGQTAWYRARSGENATGCVESRYKTALGQGEFLQTDPLGFAAYDENLYRYVKNSPVNLTDPEGLLSECCQDWLDCFNNCLAANDPLGVLGRTTLTAAGGTVPKSLIGASSKTLGQSSRITTLISRAALGTRAGPTLRAVGRFFSPLWIAYGLALAAVETHCAAACAADNCAY